MAFVLVFLCFQGLFMISVLGGSNLSSEHKIRDYLLANYDKNVRPVIGNKTVEVEFGMKISRLVKVDTKEQTVTLDTWVIQRWINEFLVWEPNDFGGVDLVQFVPDEIWVPDISLFNNGDDSVTLAGGRTKFVTEVSVGNNGMSVWSGPATFKANCQLEIGNWPFDNQTCELGFGSYTNGVNRMDIKLFKDKSSVFTKRFVTSGDWNITGVSRAIKLTNHGDCCPFDFSEVVYTLKMSRKPLYYLFYLAIPSIMLMFITLTSFLIPVESGERIGFVTTMLLAMSVFLLLIPSFLPETSNDVPILGLSLQATLVIIALVLFANIFVLKVFFMEGTPPEWVQNVFNLCNRKKRKSVQRIHMSSSEEQPSVKSPATSVNAIELSTSPTANMPRDLDEKEEEITWQKVSIRLDHVFFLFFVLCAVVFYCAIYLQ
ncbi:neuronal acetylcholine receptor subunit alpha-5-like isoform X2 [Oculina patagonica]